ncbi:MAG: SbcC/MukB-like Walker B domain-containing protein [Bacillota bacterium]|nr:SbcC/MukB-like Walker B domain-containing protein [Bacillota bacterium]MDW7676759.1 SbcC/MukB-like Walker B domain-containing protein [Bacillota bacterium]
MTKKLMKKLTRIRLINWHYFVDETIRVDGSFLISGENTSGKSTLLDAIQLVLTTNYKQFNTAANEKSTRDLKGYVRCKTGNENSEYHRAGSIVSYVALEFYEEKTRRHFVLGAKMDSPDEETKVTAHWFQEECELEDLAFITGDRPSVAEEFRKGDKKVALIKTNQEAKDRFARRMGNLETRFFDIIPKSLAFKPMDNVKGFINQFLLSRKTIEVDTLKTNIAKLKELEDLMAQTKRSISDLKVILDKNGEIVAKDREIRINELLIKKAELEAKGAECDQLKNGIRVGQKQLETERERKKTLEEDLDRERQRLVDLKLSLKDNENTRLINEANHQIALLQKDQNTYLAAVSRLEGMLQLVRGAAASLRKHEKVVIPREALDQLPLPDAPLEEKMNTLLELEKSLAAFREEFGNRRYRAQERLETEKSQRQQLEREISDLKNKIMPYEEYIIQLKQAIEKEFQRQGVSGEVRIFSELLEIADHRWQDAVEGYLNTQRFYLIVEPRHYELALGVYHRIRKEVHTVGLVNTVKLELDRPVEQPSLAYVVKSDNRYARAYATYLLNRVMRVNDVHGLKDHRTAITPDCMLYQNFAVRKIKGSVYETPYIGAHAIETQLAMKTEELEKLKAAMEETQQELTACREILGKIDGCSVSVFQENIQAPQRLLETKQAIAKEQEQLKVAESDPTYIEMQQEIQACDGEIKQRNKVFEAVVEGVGKLQKGLETKKDALDETEKLVGKLTYSFRALCDEDTAITAMGLQKYQEQVKSKSPATIVFNYSPQRAMLRNQKEGLVTELIKLQSYYCSQYTSDFGTGEDAVADYIREHHKLVASEIIKYENDLEQAKERCHLEFRESFLARLKEYIEEAENEFRRLNKALREIYYGDDRYKFDITANRKKEKIYQMIKSGNNIEGYSLLSQSFDDQYREEMEDLFDKLTAYDDKGEKVLEEYTDYRNYLDYDIIVENRNGATQRFSRIYKEKSGGETQVPYYVAIAASYSQLYRMDDTIRIIMLDEAFDKMDDNRISSMMDFFNSQEFQIILATPPGKLEVIGEKVDTILMAMRDGTESMVEVYDL